MEKKKGIKKITAFEIVEHFSEEDFVTVLGQLSATKGMRCTMPGRGHELHWIVPRNHTSVDAATPAMEDCVG